MKSTIPARTARWRHAGSLTIEAVVIFSVLILAVSLLIFLFLLVYQRLLLTKTAADAAQLAVTLMTAEKPNSLQGPQVLLEESLEGQLILPEKKDVLVGPVSQVRFFICRQLAKSLQKPLKTRINISVTGGFPADSLCVTLQQEIRIPFGPIKAFLTGRETVTLTATGVLRIIDPAQYIRNFDLLLEGISRLRDYSTR